MTCFGGHTPKLKTMIKTKKLPDGLAGKFGRVCHHQRHDIIDEEFWLLSGTWSCPLYIGEQTAPSLLLTTYGTRET